MNDILTTFERRMEILSLLKTGKKITRTALAKKFKVSLVAITRDIDALSVYAAIVSVRGRYGGVFLLSGYSDTKLYLTRKEENLLRGFLEKISDKEKSLLENVLYKFSMPK